MLRTRFRCGFRNGHPRKQPEVAVATTRATTKSPARFRLEYGATVVGGLAWVTALVVLFPRPVDTVWAKLLLLLAPLVLVPLGLRSVCLQSATVASDRLRLVFVVLKLSAAIILGVAFVLPQGLLAAALALPWLTTTGLMALSGLARAWRHRRGPMSELCVDAGLIYAFVGGFWALLDRLGMRPLDFESVIVLLTAIHFHYAGFALPVLTGLALRQVEGRFARLAGAGVIVAVPLVAVGITATKLTLGPLPECAAAMVLSGAGVLTACVYFRLAARRACPAVTRVLWAVAAVALAGSMALATLYGLRFYLTIGWLDIPWMRAVHGTANALGFGLAGLVGWTLAGERHCVGEYTPPRREWAA